MPGGFECLNPLVESRGQQQRRLLWGHLAVERPATLLHIQHDGDTVFAIQADRAAAAPENAQFGAVQQQLDRLAVAFTRRSLAGGFDGLFIQ
ncbi:hypothetical protein D3C76_1604230 [compost metagenome]